MSERTFVIMPAYNEAANVGDVVARVREQLPAATVVVVDDASRDGTIAAALAAGAVVLPHPVNMGYGVSLQTGFKYALRQGAEHVVTLDADGQHDPAGIPAVLDPVRADEYDIVIGSRFLEGSTYRISFGRRAGQYVLRRVATFLVGRTVTDPTSGFQAMNRKVLALFARDVYPVDYPDADVIVMLHKHGFRVGERPVVMQARVFGSSIHAGLKPAYYLFKMALDIPLNLLRKEPM
jgi:hypothetical protein